jgi:hypothetical protein
MAVARSFDSTEAGRGERVYCSYLFCGRQPGCLVLQTITSKAFANGDVLGTDDRLLPLLAERLKARVDKVNIRLVRC